jgi:hypothetical protein
VKDWVKKSGRTTDSKAAGKQNKVILRELLERMDSVRKVDATKIVTL